MSAQSRKSSDSGFFNDFNSFAEQTRPSDKSNADKEKPEQEAMADLVPRPKRIACCLCRKRKLKCDGSKPICGTCARLGHECKYEEARRKSGPKRGYVKALEARLAQVETLLKTQDPNESTNQTKTTGGSPSNKPLATIQVEPDRPNFISNDQGINYIVDGDGDSSKDTPPRLDHASISMDVDDQAVPDLQDFDISLGTGSMSWEMLSLGLEEPLPAQDLIDELENLYFTKCHPSMPMIHESRYRASTKLAANMRPAIHLRYSMWCLAASVSVQHGHLSELFYQRSRKYLDSAEMNNVGEAMISIQTCQCWNLIASYEFKRMYFPRAWMSTGRACRMAQMMGLYRLDGGGFDVKRCIPPPRDWVEREERRRTFWMSFCQDRYASTGTGWPMVLDEKDFATNLPSSEKAFNSSQPEDTLSLKESMTPSGISKLNPFAALVLMACLFGRNLAHLHRPDEDNRDNDLNGAFWRRHRHMDGILLNTSLSLPQHLRLPNGINDSNVIFVNMNIHTATICLHQAAIFKSDKHRLPANISAESKIRCITAAAEIASIMRTISHLDLSAMNPFMAFCLYVSARVFVQYLKSRPQDDNARSSLKFLLLAMQQLKTTNPLVESFLVQLEVDLESIGLEGFSGMINADRQYPDSLDCSPLVKIQESKPENPVSTQAFTNQSNVGTSVPADALPDRVPPPGFPSENPINLPNRIRNGFNQPSERWKASNPQDMTYKQPSLTSPDESNLRPSVGRWKSSDPADLNRDGFSRVPDMHFSPDSTGSNSAGLNSGGHPTPDTLASNLTSSHNSFTPPSSETLPTDTHHRKGASAAGGAEGMWNQSYSMESNASKDPGSMTEEEVSAFVFPPDWELHTGMSNSADFSSFSGDLGSIDWNSNAPVPMYGNSLPQ